MRSYQARKDFIKSSKLYFSAIMELPASEKALAFKILREAGIPLLPVVPLSQVQLTVKLIRTILNGIGKH